MSQPVNLNRFRKDKAKAEKRAQANENAIRHGLNKSQKDAARKETARRIAELDGKKREADE